MKIDHVKWKDIKDHADYLKGQYGERNTMFEQLENMFMMEWTDKPAGDNLKLTMSPDARNAVLGAVRLMVGTNPQFNIAKTIKQPEKKEVIENAAEILWDQSGRIRKNPIHYDALVSALLYGEMVIPITNTSELLENARKKGSGLKAAERLNRLTPFTFKAWKPTDCYPEYSEDLGMTSFYRETMVTANDIKNRFKSTEASESVADLKAYEPVRLSIWYDLDNYSAWVNDKPIQCNPHELPIIPISSTIVDGSMIFDKKKDQYQPLLYTLLQSGLWERQNLTYTVLYTLIYGIGISPQFIHKRSSAQPDRELDIDWERMGGIIELLNDESFEPMKNKGLIDPSVTVGLEIAEGKIQESTIYRQALGEAMKGSNQAFSTIALLSQSGRLPLITPQKRGGWAIAEAMELALTWYREQNEPSEILGIAPSDIPETLQLDVNLDVDLPQDKLQMANIARLLTQGEDPLASKEWARENILNIGQSVKMDNAIWSEKAANTQYIQWLMMQIRQAQMAEQARNNPPPEINSGEGGQSGDITSGPGMVEGQGEMVQGIPPQQAGMIPGQGQGAVPPKPQPGKGM